MLMGAGKFVDGSDAPSKERCERFMTWVTDGYVFPLWVVQILCSTMVIWYMGSDDQCFLWLQNIDMILLWKKICS